MSEDLSSLSDEELLRSLGISAAPKQAPRRLAAAGTGLNEGLTRLPGIPVDTALNLYDLAKAGIGTAQSAVTGRAPSTAFDPTNRENIAMSGDWLMKQARDLGAGGMVDNPSPDDALSRMLHSGGTMASSALLGGPAGLARNTAMAGVGGMGMQGAAEAGLPPSAQLLASIMGPAVMAKRGVSSAQQNVDQSVRGQTAQQALDAGLKLPPADVRPTLPNKIVQGMFAGNEATAKAASTGNIPTLMQIARDELGMPATHALTIENINRAPKIVDAHLVYSKVRDAPAITIDPAKLDLGDAAKQYQASVSVDPTARNATVDKLLKVWSSDSPLTAGGVDLSKYSPQVQERIKAQLGMSAGKEMSTETLLFRVKDLREQGFKNVASDNGKTTQLGKIQLDLAGALENQLAQHLKALGKPELASEFLNARTVLAKGSNVKDALETSTGRIKAEVLGKIYSENPNLLSGGLKTIGKTAQAFPEAVRSQTGSAPAGPSQSDPRLLAYGIPALTTAGGVGLAASGFPTMGMALASIPALRYASRSAILSGPGQKALARPFVKRNPFDRDISGILGAYAYPQTE